MAAEVFRIEIPVEVLDKTDPGVSQATRKMNGFDRANQKTKERLDKMNRSKYQVVLDAVDKVSGVAKKIGTTVGGLTSRAWSVTVGIVDKVTAPIKTVISVMGKLLGITGLVSTALAGISISKSLEEFAEDRRMRTQLKVSAKNMGIDKSGLNAILKKAESISKDTMYSDTAMIGAAAELATYFEDETAITRMMDTVIDYAAGMSGGVALSTQEMVDYTTNLAKMTTGAYDAMTKKGFEVTDIQKKILENGTDMEKVAVIEQIIKENWAGMAKGMSNTPTGQLEKVKNSWGEIAEKIGGNLSPAFTKFYAMLNTKMPAISKILERVSQKGGNMFDNLIETAEKWIDSGIENLEEIFDWAIEKAEELQKSIEQLTNSQEWKDADTFWDKLKVAWDQIIAEPFDKWWQTTGKAWAKEKGIQIKDAFVDAIKGIFKDAFKLLPGGEEASGTSWLSAIAVGWMLSKILFILAPLLSGLWKLGKWLTGTPSQFSTNTMNVTAQTVYVYGQNLQNGGGSPSSSGGTPSNTPIPLPGNSPSQSAFPIPYPSGQPSLPGPTRPALPGGSPSSGPSSGGKPVIDVYPGQWKDLPNTGPTGPSVPPAIPGAAMTALRAFMLAGILTTASTIPGGSEQPDLVFDSNLKRGVEQGLEGDALRQYIMDRQRGANADYAASRYDAYIEMLNTFYTQEWMQHTLQLMRDKLALSGKLDEKFWTDLFTFKASNGVTLTADQELITAVLNMLFTDKFSPGFIYGGKYSNQKMTDFAKEQLESGNLKDLSSLPSDPDYSLYAWGGIMTKPHMGIVAEEGAEGIIPLSPSKRRRGIDLWKRTGEMLGVQAYADGDIPDSISTTVPAGKSGTNITIKVEVEASPSFTIEKDSAADDDRIIAVLKAYIRSMVDDISDELAERLAHIFANMPVRGGS